MKEGKIVFAVKLYSPFSSKWCKSGPGEKNPFGFSSKERPEAPQKDVGVFAKGVGQFVLSEAARATADLMEAFFHEEIISWVQNVPAQNPTLMIQEFLAEGSNLRR